MTAHPPALLYCDTCGAYSELPNPFGGLAIGLHGEDGERLPVTWTGETLTQCPAGCGGWARALNSYVEVIGDDQWWNFGDDADRVAFRALIESLEALPADADADAVAEEIERHGRRFQPLASWVRSHYMELMTGAGVGLTLVGVIMQALQLANPPEQQPLPPPPVGITPAQMAELVDALEADKGHLQGNQDDHGRGARLGSSYQGEDLKRDEPEVNRDR